MEFEAVAERVITRTAAWYAARSWWASWEDLTQEGWVAALEARRTYVPSRGALSPYLGTAVSYRLRSYLWAQSAPVTGRKNHGPELRGMQRAPLSSLSDREAPDPAEVEEVERWWAELSEQVRLVIRNGKHGDAAARWLLAGERPREIADDLGWSVYRVWSASSSARRRVRNDSDLRHDYQRGLR